MNNPPNLTPMQRAVFRAIQDGDAAGHSNRTVDVLVRLGLVEEYEPAERPPYFQLAHYRAIYVPFGDVARGQCGQQCQYVSRYVDGRLGYPDLGEGLRFLGDPRDYHGLQIHRDDVAEFVRRYKAHREASGA